MLKEFAGKGINPFGNTMNTETLAEQNWVSALDGQTVSGLTSDRTITRKIERLNISDLPALVEDLRQRTSVLNPSDGNKYYSVKDPMVNGIIQPGVWRGVNVTSVEGVHNAGRQSPGGTITQVMAFGWATEINWIEARLVQNPIMQPMGAASCKTMTVIWPNLAANQLATMAASLNAASFPNPKINGETYSGTWYNSGVIPSVARDGSGIITLQLSQTYRDIPFYVSKLTGDVLTETREQLGVTTETPEPMVSAVGVIKHQQITPNADNSKDIHTVEETAIQVSTPEYIAALSENTTVYRSEEKHAVSIPVIALGTNDASVSLTHDLDDFLEHNYTKTRIVLAFPFTGEKTWTIWGGLEKVTSQVYSNTLGRYWNDHCYTYHHYTEITVKYFKTEEDARAYIHLTSGSEGGGSGYTILDSTGSHYNHTGDFEYQAVKVRNKKLLLTGLTVDYLEPLS